MKKKSVEMHRLQGTYRPDRHAGKARIQYPPGADRPRFLSKWGRQEWDRVAPMLIAAEVLQESDTMILAAYCESYSAWRAALEHLAKHGPVLMVKSTTRTGESIRPAKNPSLQIALDAQRSMLASAARFGFDPTSRMKLETAQANPDADTNPEAENDSDDDDALFFPDAQHLRRMKE